MTGEMLGEAVEHCLDLGFIGNAARRPAPYRGEECVAEIVRGKEAVEIAAGDHAIGGHGTFIASVLKPDEGSPAGRPLGASDMHFIAAQLSAARQPVA